MIRSLTLLCLLAATPAAADGADDFVMANTISTLYHEYAHAMIDLAKPNLPGNVEDAADILSVLLLNTLWEEDAAESITALTALSFELAAQESEDPAYWAAHSLDTERYYHQVCLFYGADPDARASLAADFEISDARAAACVADYATATTTWAAAFMPTGTDKPSKTIQFNGDTATDIPTLMAEELRDLNDRFALPKTVAGTLAACGAENALYDPATATITLCTEFIAFLDRQAIANDL